MSRVIRVDDDVFSALQERAEPLVDTPNDVLRRILELDARPPSSPEGSAEDTSEHAAGALTGMLRTGALKVGDTLVWDRSRLGTVHRATVTAGGRLRVEGLDGQPFKTPSGAARALCGHEINGWKQWRRERDGELLQDLR